ncbi:MAG: response regulator transcription factor [Caldilineaceae bacterium]
MHNKLASTLEKMGHVIYRTSKHSSLYDQLTTPMPQLVLMMTTFPHTQAFQDCREIRQKSHVPLIVFTDSHQPDSIIPVYELGADAVISSPFLLQEVEMRILAVLRRSTKMPAPFWAPLTVGKILLDDFRHEVTVDNQCVELTPTDYRLLCYFMQNVNQVISKAALLQTIWGNEVSDGSNLVEVAIRRLRQKIEKNPSKPQYLLTVHGFGYKLVKPSTGY